MAKPLLSIGMIVKDEIRCLERCLQSLAPLRRAIPCELVIADTGSTDGSRAVAGKYADLLFDFPWVNDFAAARNAVLDRCTGAWYMTIDADEWMEAESENLVRFFRSVEQMEYDFLSTVQRNYLSDDVQDYTDSLVVRIARMRGKLLRYQGAIHEVLEYADKRQPRTLVRTDIIQHHDGDLATDPETKRRKNHRNMVLLRRYHQEHPDDLRCLLQCLQSAEDQGEALGFVKAALDQVKKPAAPDQEAYVSGIYQECVRVLYTTGNTQAMYACLEEGLQRSPASFLLRVDGNAFAAAASYQAGKHADALRYIQDRREAMKGVRRKEDLKQAERYASQYATNNVRWNNRLSLLWFYTNLEQGREEAAKAALQEIDDRFLTCDALGDFVRRILDEAWWEESADRLRKIWTETAEEAERGEGDGAGKKAEDRLKSLINGIRNTLPAQLPRIAEAMASVPPGQSARILLAGNEREIEKIWAEIDDRRWVFPEVYLRMMEMRMPLPREFYSRPAEQMAASALDLLETTDGMFLARITADWLTHIPPETPMALLWALTLLESAFQVEGWQEDENLAERLSSQYQTLSALYLFNIYNPELLNEEDLYVLPGIRRFGWHVWRAGQLLEAGDQVGYIRQLRAGLPEAPELRGLVTYLMNRVSSPKPTPAPELLTLAEQVQTILAQYPPDDPAVARVKASPAYQTVAALLEQQGCPGQSRDTNPPSQSPAPALAQAMADLLDACAFDSPEEGADAIRRAYQKIPVVCQEELSAYWARFPLWGRTPDQVFAAAGAALSRHREELAWLFLHLGDDQSRRVLLAVVSNWRYFDMEQLEQVKETCYDAYFHRDLISCHGNEVVADLGAYVGDTFLSYVKNYGDGAYRRYYAYEITEESFRALERATQSYPRVVLRRKGAGDGPGTMTVETGRDASANTLAAGETTVRALSAQTVEMAALDEDIDEPITLIKMDIEGAEQAALRGCARHIREDRPKLALSVYHNFEDIWKLPQMIEALVPGYRFYLRYHGGNLWATEVSLLALPPQEN